MRRVGRVLLAGAVAIAAIAPGGIAAADDALARRLATLRFLVDPERPSAIPVPKGATGCGAIAAWRASKVASASRTRSAIRDASLRFAVPARLLSSVIRQESAGDPNAVSPVGAMGLMQLMPATARELGVRCPFDPRENVLGGARYLRALRDRFGRWPSALAAYHAGPARVEAGRIPRITRRYVARVLRGWNPRREWGAWL